MKITLFQISKYAIFLKLSKNLPNGFKVTMASVFGINQDIITINNDENIKFACQNFVDITLEASKDIKKTKKYDLLFKIAVLLLESYFLLITFLNSQVII